MDLMARLFGGGMRADGPWAPTDDRWYQSGGGGVMTAAGMSVDVESAKKLSAWYRGRDILATVLAMLPLVLFERLSDDAGAEVARSHPLYDVLHDQANVWQDSFQWRRQKMFHLIDHGNGYDRIVPGVRGFADQLRPIHPTLVTPKQLSSGRLVYHVRDPKTGISTPSTADEIFHLRGASDDGIVGKGILEAARTSLGTALATESYAANIFSRGTLNGGVIENPGVLNDDASKRMAKTFMTAPGEWHLPKVLEQGSKWVQNDMTPEDAQMLLSRKQSVDDIARWLGLPRMMLENSDPSFGNAEQFNKNFITIHMGGWLSLWEFGIRGQLILNPRRFYAEFIRDAFERGDLSTRWAAHVAAVNAGIKSVDEVRGVENLNKRGGKADELREPQNITGKPAIPDARPVEQPPPRKPAPPDPPRRKKAEAIATESASRLLRKEIQAVQKAAARHAKDEDAFAVAVTEFYVRHVELVLQTLQMSRQEAEHYCAGQAAQLVDGDWVAALDTWKTDTYAADVAAIALEEAA